MRISFEFEDLGVDTIEYETEQGQQATVAVEDGIPVLYLNQPACVFLAKLFTQLGHGRFSPGFHIHLGKGLDPEAPEAIRVVIAEAPIHAHKPDEHA